MCLRSVVIRSEAISINYFVNQLNISHILVHEKKKKKYNYHVQCMYICICLRKSPIVPFYTRREGLNFNDAFRSVGHSWRCILRQILKLKPRLTPTCSRGCIPWSSRSAPPPTQSSSHRTRASSRAPSPPCHSSPAGIRAFSLGWGISANIQSTY